MSKRKRILITILIIVISLFILQFVWNFIMRRYEDNAASQKYEYGSIDWSIERARNGRNNDSEKIQYDTIDEYYVGMIYNREAETPLGKKIYAESIAGVRVDGKYSLITISNWDKSYLNNGNNSKITYLESLRRYRGEESVLVVAETRIGSFIGENAEKIVGDIDVVDNQGKKYFVIQNDETPFRVYYMTYEKEKYPSDLKLYYSVNGEKALQFDLSVKTIS